MELGAGGGLEADFYGVEGVADWVGLLDSFRFLHVLYEDVDLE